MPKKTKDGEPAAGPPRLELKDLSGQRNPPHDWLQFEATVWVDGVAAFTARNPGQGGVTFLTALPGQTRGVHTEINLPYTSELTAQIRKEVPRAIFANEEILEGNPAVHDPDQPGAAHG